LTVNGSPEAVALLRDRLIALRDNLRQRIAAADHLDAGLLAVLAHAEVALQALDAEPTR
jgi:hypothetical protein